MIRAAHDRVLTEYLAAKDEQRPHLMKQVFSDDAVFESRFEFDTDFPTDGPSVGQKAVIDAFRGLGAMMENIYTVCTVDSVDDAETTMSCGWLVGMSERATGRVRVAWGDYRWTFDHHGTRATELIVTMKHMAFIEPEQLDAVMVWLRHLPSPWVSAEQLVGDAPAFDELAPMGRYFA